MQDVNNLKILYTIHNIIIPTIYTEEMILLPIKVVNSFYNTSDLRMLLKFTSNCKFSLMLFIVTLMSFYRILRSTACTGNL